MTTDVLKLGVIFLQAIQFKTDVIEYLLEDPFKIDTKQNLVKYFEITLEDAVIKGGNYFRISYEFLGSVIPKFYAYAKSFTIKTAKTFLNVI